MSKITWQDLAAAALATTAVSAYVLSAAAWFLIFPTIGLLWTFGVLP